ncbi:MAG: hypothetical protein ACK502_01640 [Alphaproteobacteria bacterium]
METKHPLSLLEKIGVGIKSFGKAVIDYLPRGILISGLMLGASAVMGNMGGWDLFGTAELGAGDFIKRMAIGVGIGSLITGGVAAYQGVKAHTQFRDKEIEMQEAMLAREHARSRGKSRESGDDMEIVSGGGLPANAKNSNLVRQHGKTIGE